MKTLVEIWDFSISPTSTAATGKYTDEEIVQQCVSNGLKSGGCHFKDIQVSAPECG